MEIKRFIKECLPLMLSTVRSLQIFRNGDKALLKNASLMFHIRYILSNGDKALLKNAIPDVPHEVYSF